MNCHFRVLDLFSVSNSTMTLSLARSKLRLCLEFKTYVVLFFLEDFGKAFVTGENKDLR